MKNILIFLKKNDIFVNLSLYSKYFSRFSSHLQRSHFSSDKPIQNLWQNLSWKEGSQKIKDRKNSSMAPSEQLPNVVMEEDDYSETEGSDSEDSNDSQDDPTYDIFEETQSGFSNLSMEKKSKSRLVCVYAVNQIFLCWFIVKTFVFVLKFIWVFSHLQYSERNGYGFCGRPGWRGNSCASAWWERWEKLWDGSKNDRRSARVPF